MEGSFMRFRLESKNHPKSTTGPAKKRRTKTGCLTCRVRRKKCDELQPLCVACRRNYLICEWPNTKRTNEDEDEDSSIYASGNWGLSCQLAKASSAEGLDPAQLIRNPPLGHEIVNSYLLEHYLYVTAHQLAGREQAQNPFVVHLLPLAFQDRKVLDGLLAVSGAHLSSQAKRFEHDARSHYAATIRSVKYALLEWRTLDSSALLALLTTTLLLCYFESIIGDTRGAIFYHLRASRTAILELQKRSSHEVDPSTLDFLTEWYAFSAIAANVTLHPDFATVPRDIPIDPFLSPDALANLNKGHSSYGILFGSAHKLLGLILPILDAARRLPHDASPAARQQAITAFESLIRGSAPGVLRPHPPASEAATAIYQQALLTFLYTTFHGTRPPTAELYAKVDPCVDRLFELMPDVLPRSAVLTTLMWPALIVGSCVRKPAQQAVFAACLESLPLRMGSCRRVREVLGCLWVAQAGDCSVYGPLGLESVMRREDINICVS